MARYRKKPVVVEAAQWHAHGDHPAVKPITRELLARTPVWVQDDVADLEQPWAYGLIPTLEGAHLVRPGDWIITGVQGEHYPCKPDIFAATYEEVT